MAKQTIEHLKELQALPLDLKVQLTKNRIREWVREFGIDGVYIAFSGGKDSTVLLDIARQDYPDIPAVFVNTGLEYPEIQHFVRTFDNVEILYPTMRFDQVITKFGYPMLSKELSETFRFARLNNDSKTGDARRERLLGTKTHVMEDGTIVPSKFNSQKWLPASQLPIRISNECCRVMKKTPSHKYSHKTGRMAIIASLTEESRLRESVWLKYGCNQFDGVLPSSKPMSFWTEQDVLSYIKQKNLRIASVYGDIVYVDKNGDEYDSVFDDAGFKLKCTGCDRTGCIFCAYAFHRDKGETRFQRLAKTHPRQYEYCMGGGEWVDNKDYDPTLPEYRGDWKVWNPKQVWQPNKNGLGLKKVFDMFNEIYPGMYRYE